MDLSWFKDLEQLSKTGNFSQAANVRNISQPAFSRRIKALEAWVGTQLVDRGRHPISLTSAGKQMLEASQQALERLEYERTQIIEAQSLPDKYVVTFGAQHSIGWRFFPAWLQAFENVEERVEPHYSCSDQSLSRTFLYKTQAGIPIVQSSSLFASCPNARIMTQSLI